MIIEQDISSGDLTKQALGSSLFGGKKATPLCLIGNQGLPLVIRVTSINKRDDDHFQISGTGNDQGGKFFIYAGEVDTAFCTGSLTLTYL